MIKGDTIRSFTGVSVTCITYGPWTWSNCIRNMATYRRTDGASSQTFGQFNMWTTYEQLNETKITTGELAPEANAELKHSVKGQQGTCWSGFKSRELLEPTFLSMLDAYTNRLKRLEDERKQSEEEAEKARKVIEV